MLSKFIATSYALLLEVSLWISLALAGIVGYNATIPIFQALGGSPYPEFVWKLVGASAFIFIGFLFIAVITGPLLVLIDIRRAVTNIAAGMVNDSENASSRNAGRKEPTI
jgi:signal transduction histidine kinase